MNEILKDLQGKRIRYTCKVARIGEKEVILSDVRTLAEDILPYKLVEMHRTPRFNKSGAKEGDTIRLNATLVLAKRGCKGTSMWCIYKNPRHEVVCLRHPSNITIKKG